MSTKFQKTTNVLLSALLCLSSTGVVFAQGYNGYYPQYQQSQPQYQQQYNQQYQQPSYGVPYAQPVGNTLQGRVVTVPAGVMLPSVTAMSNISSETLSNGDSVSANLDSDFYYNGSLVAPRGSRVIGTVVLAQKAGFAGKYGKLKVKFTSIETTMGQSIPISGKIETEDGSGILVGGTTKGRAAQVAKDAAVGSALGALSGLVFGSMSGGKAGKGAALGTAVGGGLGLAKSGINKGDDAVIEAGSRIDIKLDQPLTVGTQPSYNYNNPTPTINQLPGLNY